MFLKKRIIIIMLICSLIGLSIIDIVNATTYNFDFEDGTITNQYTSPSGFISTGGNETNSYITNLNCFEGNRCYEVKMHEVGKRTYFNFTYGENILITNITWDMFMDYDSDDNTDAYMYFNNDYGQHILMFWWDYNNPPGQDKFILKYHDVVAGWQDLTVSLNGDQYQKFSIQYNANDSVEYFLHDYDSGSDYYADAAPHIVTGNDTYSRITQIEFKSGTHNVDFHIDLLNITTGSSFSTGGCGDTPSSTFIGNFVTPNYRHVTMQQYTLESYRIKVTGAFNAFDLQVSNEFIEDQDSFAFSNYELYVNGEYMGIPSCYTQVSDESYVLRWLFDGTKTLNDEYPIFAIYSAIPLSYYPTAYLDFVHPGGVYADIDSDGDKIHKGMSTDDFLDEYIGDIYSYDIPYRFYYTSISASDDTKSYSNTLGLHNFRGAESNGTKYYYTGDSVIISYTLEDMTVGNYIRIFKKGVEYGLDQGFGTSNLLYQQSGTLGFVPTEIGIYNISIMSGGTNKTNIYCSVSSNPDENRLIYTVPGVTFGTQEYKVVYNYTHPDGWKGAVGMAYGKIPNTIDDCDFFIEITSGTVGNFIFYPDENINTHYWRLFSTLNNVSTFIGFSGIHRHYAYTPGIATNEINVRYERRSGVSNINYFTGTHTQLGANIVVQVNNITEFTGLGYEQTFFLEYRNSKPGLKVVTLRVLQNTTWAILDTAYYNVTGETESDDGVLPPLDETMGAIAGLILTIFCMLSPLLITSGLKTKQGVPAIAYAFTGCLGIGVSVLFGFFPFWIVPFIVIIGIIILTTQYIFKSGSNNGE